MVFNAPYPRQTHVQFRVLYTLRCISGINRPVLYSVINSYHKLFCDQTVMLKVTELKTYRLTLGLNVHNNIIHHRNRF